MEPTGNNSKESFTEGHCVLRVMTGKNQGARRVLKNAVTLLGSEKGCDIRLSSADVELLQCVIVETPQGYLVRNLYDCQKVVVNGEPVEVSPLHSGDELSIGPFSFLVDYAKPALREQSTVTPEIQIEEERQALRIQAAAVAAQQTMLMEKELQLRDQGLELTQKEKQLAAGLKEKHLRLLQLQRSLKSKASNLQQQESAILGQLQHKEKQLDQGILAASSAKAQYEQFRARFKSRWKKVARRALETQSQKEKLLDAGLQKLKRDREKHEREIEAHNNLLGQQRADLELEKRELKAAWDKLETARQEAVRKEQDAEITLARREKDISSRESQVHSAERELLAEQKRWNNHLEKLHLESEGLEKRISLLRKDMDTLPVPLVALAPPQSPALPPAPEDITQFMKRLEQVAGTLYDQRLRLLEAWENIELKRQEFHAEQTRILDELEATGKTLDQREKQLSTNEFTLQLKFDQLREKAQKVSTLRSTLEARASEMESQRVLLESERSLLNSQWKQRRESLEKMFSLLQQSRRTLSKRRLSEQNYLQKQQSQIENVRQGAAALWQQCQTKLEELETQRESLAIQELALGRLSLEIMAKSSDAPGTERKLEKLRKSIEDRYKSEHQQILDARQELARNASQIETRWKEFYSTQAELHLRAEDSIQMQNQLDEARLDFGRQKISLDETIGLLKNRGQEQEKKLQSLQQELEKLHSVLIEETQVSEFVPNLTLRAA